MSGEGSPSSALPGSPSEPASTPSGSSLSDSSSTSTIKNLDVFQSAEDLPLLVSNLDVMANPTATSDTMTDNDRIKLPVPTAGMFSNWNKRLHFALQT